MTNSVNGIYAVIQATGLIGRQYLQLQELRGDDSKPGGGQMEAPMVQIITGTHDASNSVLADVWPTFYVLIHRANSVINVGPNVPGDDALKKQLIAEAKFLRAWAYFQLVTLWGPVPLSSTSAITPSEVKNRASVEDVNKLIIQDLIDAQEGLPTTFSGANLGRATKGAAQTLLGQVYLQKLEYKNAKAEFQKVIDSKVYSLTEKYNDNFIEETEFNKESIFEVGFQASGNFGWGNNTGDGLNEVGETTMRNQDFSGTSWRNYIPTSGLLREFENTKAGDVKTDPRLSDNFYFSGDKFNNGTQTLTDNDQRGDTVQYYGVASKVSWKKYTATYKTNSGYYPGGINFRLLRYGHVLLMMAEALNDEGDMLGAIGLLNQLRNRPSVMMPQYPTVKFPCTNREEVFKAIMHEKRVETAGEQVRNFDILRWRKAGKFTKNNEPLSYYTLLGSKLDLLPIPQAEMANNPNIGGQNPQY